MYPLIISSPSFLYYFFFFLNYPPTPEIYPLPLHDPLPISGTRRQRGRVTGAGHHSRSRIPLRRRDPHSCHATALAANGARSGLTQQDNRDHAPRPRPGSRSEEHTSELQSRLHLVCRLLLEK